jgi:hypothetical protein
VNNLFERLFNRDDKQVTSRDLKVALMGVKRERRKKQLEMRRMTHKRNEAMQRLKNARKDNNKEEVDFVYEELQQLKIDQALCKREAKVLNLEGIGLKRYIRGLERLERAQNKTRIKDLIDKVRMSGLDEKLRGQTVDEDAYLDTLNATLEDLKIEMEDVELSDDEDPDKEKFLEQIDEIIAAEEEGDLDLAVEKEDKLKEKLEKEGEGEDVSEDD